MTLGFISGDTFLGASDLEFPDLLTLASSAVMAGSTFAP
jgi:hypothetical protein